MYCLRISIDIKRHHEHCNSNKKNFIEVEACSFRGLVSYYHGRTWQDADRHDAGYILVRRQQEKCGDTAVV